MSKEIFLHRLKNTFAPRLRGVGFTGSGSNFFRVQDFRKRLTPNKESDYWWQYESDPDLSEQSADALVRTFFEVGERHFEAYSSLSAILDALHYVAASEMPVAPSLGTITRVRAALTAARIYAHVGNRGECRRLATIGLAHLGPAVALKEELESLSAEHA